METFNFNQLRKFFNQHTKHTKTQQTNNQDDEQTDVCLKEEETADIQTDTSRKLGMFEFRTKIVWFNAIGFLAMHLAGLYGTYLGLMQIFNLQLATTLWSFLMIFIGGEGITIGAHRLWTHRSYKATLPLQILLIIGQTIAGQNCCYIWARDHRQHHKYSDTDADPHNATRGFFFSHIGWLMMKKHPQVLKKGKGINMSDLDEDRVITFQKKYYKPLYVLLAMFLPMSVPMYFWGETLWNAIFMCFFARYIILLNITWCVNSVAHIYGTRPYDKNLVPVESAFVSFIGLGEGWHNYHHAFPWDYKASEFGMSLNGTTRIIEFFAKIGWAYDLKEASDSLVKRKIENTGDGSHPLFGNKTELVAGDCGLLQTEQQFDDLDERLSEQLSDAYRQNKDFNNNSVARRNMIRSRHG